MKHTSYRVVCLVCAHFLLASSASATEPQLRKDSLFAFDLQPEQTILYTSPTQSLRITGPAEVSWAWKDGKLSITSAAGTAQVRPVESFPSAAMTDAMILRAQQRYSKVPRIAEILGANAAPSLREWAAAYSQWLEEIEQAESALRDDYAAHAGFDKDTLVAGIATSYASHPLVAPGRTRVSVSEEDSPNRDLWVVYQGIPDHPDGTPDEWLIQLRAADAPPAAPRTWFGQDEALALHHLAYIAAATGRPFTLDLSRGERLTTGNRR